MPSTILNLKNTGTNANGSPLVAIRCTTRLLFLLIGQNFRGDSKYTSIAVATRDKEVRHGFVFDRKI